MYVNQINIGEGSAWFEVRKDGEQKAFFKLYNQGTYTYRQNDIEIYMQLEQVFQGQVDSLAVVYIMMADVISDEETMLEVPVEEVPVEEVWEVPVEETPMVEPEAPVEVEEVPEPEGESMVPIIIGGLLIILLFFGIIIKKSKKSNDLDGKASIQVPPKIIEENQNVSIKQTPETKPINTIEVKSAFSYKGATILYKIKVENPTLEPIGDIKVNLYVPDVFLVSESTKTIVMLKPSESKTVTFEIRPTGECGDCEVSGKVVYYDYSTKKTSEIEIPAKNLSIVCPMLRVKEISESEWHNIVSNFVETEESTKDIDMSAETLFTMVSRIVKDMHMHPLNPEITNSPQLYNGVARFYGEGVKGLKYAAQIEVVGGAKKEALTGFYHGLLDEIEKRVHVKGYINDSIVQNVYHYGDNIGTQVKDSLVQRSNVGTGADVKKCPNCSRDVDANEKFCLFCLECGTKL
jgi:hypothetical protein